MMFYSNQFDKCSVHEVWECVQVQQLAPVTLTVTWKLHERVFGVRVHDDLSGRILWLVSEWKVFETSELKVLKFTSELKVLQLATITFAVSRELHEGVFGVRVHDNLSSWIFSLVSEWGINELERLEVQNFQVHKLWNLLSRYKTEEG